MCAQNVHVSVFVYVRVSVRVCLLGRAGKVVVWPWPREADSGTRPEVSSGSHMAGCVVPDTAPHPHNLPPFARVFPCLFGCLVGC